jgi:hypothetical protein
MPWWGRRRALAAAAKTQRQQRLANTMYRGMLLAVAPAMPKPDIKQLSDLIVRYLLKHPEARDSMEGIAEWWLLLQRIEDEVDNVKQALDLLVAEGLVEVEGAGRGSGRKVYRLNLKNRKALARFTDPDSEVFG